MKDRAATASIRIEASASAVWKALTEPSIIKKYMFGTETVSDWQVGNPIAWKGEWNGKEYEDKGIITQFLPPQTLEYTHFSPLEGKPDDPENYHTVTIELYETNGSTLVTLSQTNNPTDEARHESERNWNMMLEGLKKTVESV